ncbi:hypothetical protein C8R42DRAFT_723589 [Lentinula raphanica]|nr:hypothetical protein C8R42DRAFT_723589 [Lentinula raphanica]
MENASQCHRWSRIRRASLFQSLLEGPPPPVWDLGVNLSEIARRFTGGTSEFVNSLLETRIKGDYTMLRIDYTTISTILLSFLEGSGLPPPLTMQELQGRFADVVPLDDVSKKEFRMRMFCWATTGVPHILVDGSYTEVCLVPDDSPQYMRHGTSDEARSSIWIKAHAASRPARA